MCANGPLTHSVRLICKREAIASFFDEKLVVWQDRDRSPHRLGKIGDPRAHHRRFIRQPMLPGSRAAIVAADRPACSDLRPHE